MCGPLAIASAAVLLSLGTTTAQFVGQQQMHQQVTQAANQEAALKHNVSEQQRVQLDRRQSEDRLSSIVQQAQSFGSIAASASALGMGRSSLVQAQNASAVGYARERGIQAVNIAGSRYNLANERYATELGRVSKINSTPAPGLASLALGIGNSFLSGADMYVRTGGKF